MTKVLAIETSCDETAASVVTNHMGIYRIDSNIKFTKFHRQCFGIGAPW